ncbi:nif-specific transcriptional activator NifA [Blastopirellula marina]|uniref:Nif-specific regulatory protein n=1 Tax=Blastopirellula marina TaxID=124 RepID=A0A2S8GPJ7_9BACT|nr:nif-specific transcriptional activator NifA [Blastopirellula marina]PQO45924.1 nif-specific transcriptional activator NifA [Blastopirellula marina]
MPKSFERAIGETFECHACPLNLELEAMYNVTNCMSSSDVGRSTLATVLDNLQLSEMSRGMITLADEFTRKLVLEVIQDEAGADVERNGITYQFGEGIIGSAFEQNRVVIVPRVGDESRFAGKLGIYDPNRPFIAVPISANGKVIGVLAAQPKVADMDRLESQSRFLVMIANLVGQIAKLSQDHALEKCQLTDQRDRLLEQLSQQYGFENIIGRSDPMRRVFQQISAVAKWTTTVLIRGESGTGKELVAHAIHYNSQRADKPFVKLNAAVLSDNLLESELFGYEKGAFTGATEGRPGRFERADGGTLFLDEIGEISPGFQSKLLRVLQEGEFERVGSSQTKSVDVRIIAATNRDLEADVEAGKFREDLYYRLNVMPIYMPPLRARCEDIPDLAMHLVRRISDRQGRDLSLSQSATALLMRYDWPGNVRELENCLERAAVMAGSAVIDREAIVDTGLEDRIMSRGGTLVEAPANFNDPDLDERDRIVAALEHCGWVQAKAARLLGMTPRQIAYRIQTLDIKVRRI